jgi:hypothetical protein
MDPEETSVQIAYFCILIKTSIRMIENRFIYQFVERSLLYKMISLFLFFHAATTVQYLPNL